ncbi:MAG: hypothetical protein JW812_01535 [Alphaproteobacteria bacterium]|nr:hypothetical protein [Alphaproteobacteria bacterium]MBN2779594.1 hypothetical protein [Alphaproteobacteria bacterium]
MKKILLISLVLAGCGPRFIGNPPESMSQRISLMERQISTQAGKLEVIEHQNEIILKEMDMLKKGLTLQNNDITPLTNMPLETPVVETGAPTDLDTLPPMPPSPITED